MRTGRGGWGWPAGTARRQARLALLALLVALAAALLPVVARVTLAQEVPDPGPPDGGGGGGVDLGPILGGLGGLGGLADAIGGLQDWLGERWADFLAVVGWALGMAPRVVAMAVLTLFGIVAHALITALGLGEIGRLLTTVPEGPLMEGWVQTLVLDMKGIAFLVLVPAVALRAFTWNVGLAREDAGELLRDAFLAGVLVATVDGWALLAVRLLNALAAGLAGGDPVLPGAADAGQMAQQAALPLSFAPFPADGDVQRALQETADAFAVQAEAAAARGVLSLVWATAAFWGGLAAVARVMFVVVLFVLAPLAAMTPVLPWGGGLLKGWAAVFLGAVGVQLVVALLLRIATVGLLAGVLPSQAAASSAWAVLVGAAALAATVFLLWKAALGGVRVSVSSLRRARSAAATTYRAGVAAAPVVRRVATPVYHAAQRVPLLGPAVGATGAVTQRVVRALPPGRPAAASPAAGAGAPAPAGAAVPSRRGP
jgi:hypothetical protein